MSDVLLDSPTTQLSFLAGELLTLYDDFLEFQGYCAFWCDAMSAITTLGVELDDASREGAHAFSEQVKQNAQALKNRLKELQEKSCVGS